MKKFLRKLCAAVTAVSLFIIGPCVNANAVTTASGAIAKGIDVSKHNGAINWAQVKNSGVSFAFIKIGSTYSGVDPMFHYNITSAQANGIKTGVYLYSYATNVEQAAAEASLVVQWLAAYSLQMPVVYDIEDRSQAAIPTDQLNAMINTFCAIIDAAGYYPMVYSYKNFYNGKIGATPWDKWAAQYGSQLDMGSGVSFWQYTSSGSVPGINGRVDMNYQYKDYSKLIIPEGFIEHNGNTRFYLNYKMQTGWASYQGNKYFLDAAGNMVRGLFTDADGKTYYLDPKTGAASIGPTNIQNLIFYFDGNGVLNSGFIDYGQGVKYFDPLLGGAMQVSNFFAANNGMYYAGKDGTLYTGLQSINGAQYYFNEAGIMQIGLQNINGANYFFGETGAMSTGLVAVNNALCYFGKDGAQQYGLVDFGQGARYFDPEAGGAMAVNKSLVINGVQFIAGADGTLTEVPVEVPEADAAVPAA